MKKHVIWSNDYDTIEALEKDIKENPDDFVAGYSDGDDGDFWSIAYQLNDDYLGDEMANLNVEVGNEIIIIASLGLWNGRRMGYKELHKTNIRYCLDAGHTCGDYITWYVDEHGDLMCEDIHHDGTNFYTYRAWKNGISDTQKENFLDKVYRGVATRDDITRYTRKLGQYIADVYGW